MTVKISTVFGRVAVLVMVVIASIITLSSSAPVFAGVNCSGYCHSCDPHANGDTYECSSGDDGSYRVCCWDGPCNGSCNEVSYKPKCGNCKYYCDKEQCSCDTVNCPSGNGANKFMTKAVNQGSGRRCDDPCNPDNYTCPQKHVNTAPTCSISPGSISMTREDAAKQIQINVHDNDYGDTVQVTHVRVIDTAGNLKSCVKVMTLGGGGLENLVVKNGSDSSGNTDQTTTIQIDPREAHGVFDNISGQSVCSGKIELEIRDLVGTSGDTSDYVKCSVDISVTNQAPQLTDVSIYDKEPNASFREGGDLVNGTTLFVGSLLTSKQAHTCNAPLTMLDPILCNQANRVQIASRHNPLEVEFTVSDANGADDIMEAGIWIQRASADANSVSYPITTATTRESIQALYSEKDIMNFENYGNRPYFVSMACLSGGCGPTNIATSSKQIFSGLALIASRGNVSRPNGNISNSPYKYSSAKSWQRSVFPDCLTGPISNCTGSNVPSVSQSGADGNQAIANNFDWVITADETHMLCYQINNPVPSVVAASNPATCPVDCAACAKKEGVTAVGGNSLKFKFGVYFNDSDGGSQKMASGVYKIFLHALDKVGVPLNNVTGKGDDGWAKFDKNGNLCTGATCSAGDFMYVYDPDVPKVNNVTWQVVGTDGVKVTASMSDTAGGSGIAGVTNRFMIRQALLDGEPLGEREWALKLTGEAFDGSNDRVVSSSTSATVDGKGLQAGEEIVAGLCVYDNAGNSSCGRSGTPYVFLAPWIKTSLGDVYSKGTTDASAFVQTLPEAGDVTKTSSYLYAPFATQENTAATGLVMTGTGVIGISGGYLSGGTNYQLGFAGEYRTTGGSAFNVLNFNPKLPGLEYERLRAASQKNCELLNETVPNTCLNSTNIGDLALPAGPLYKLITLGAGTTTLGAATCTGANVIFVTGTLTVNGSLIKSNPKSACMFVVNTGATLEIVDIPSNDRDYVAGVGYPKIDRFEGAIVGGPGSTIRVNKGTRGATVKSTDRLEIKGFVFSDNTLPMFQRVLAPVDNRRMPSEWIIYDSNLLDVLRPILGAEKTVDVTCGTSSHVLCKTE